MQKLILIFFVIVALFIPATAPSAIPDTEWLQQYGVTYDDMDELRPSNGYNTNEPPQYFPFMASMLGY